MLNSEFDTAADFNIIGEIVSTGKLMKSASEFVIRNVKTNRGFFRYQSICTMPSTINTSTSGTPAWQEPNLKITIDGVTLLPTAGDTTSETFGVQIRDLGTTQLYQADIFINNVSSVDGSSYPPSLNISMGGVCKVSNSTFEYVDFTAQGTTRLSYYLNFHMSNSLVRNRADTRILRYPLVYFNEYVHVMLDNSTIIAQSALGLGYLGASAHLNNCTP